MSKVEVIKANVNLIDRKKSTQVDKRLRVVIKKEIETLNIRDVIKIEYDFLFEEYDPTYGYVNTVTLEQTLEIGVN